MIWDLKFMFWLDCIPGVRAVKRVVTKDITVPDE